MHSLSIVIAAFLVTGGTGATLAQSNARVAPGAEAPDTPRVFPDGQIEPAPSQRVTGGVGDQELPSDLPQTRSGGPVGGNKVQQE